MANSFGNSPIVLDTFSSAIDVGDSMFGDSHAAIFLDRIVWADPTSSDHTATVTDGGSRNVFVERAEEAYKPVERVYNKIVRGLKVAASGVESGKLYIHYK